jgi:hypothetical protein
MPLALAKLVAFNVIVSRTAYISKTKFLQGLQCPKLIWSSYNAKHLFPAVDDALQAVFNQGHESRQNNLNLPLLQTLQKSVFAVLSKN